LEDAVLCSVHFKAEAVSFLKATAAILKDAVGIYIVWQLGGLSFSNFLCRIQQFCEVTFSLMYILF